jgi:molybdenum cofactor biosynthesis enzyme MoaA
MTAIILKNNVEQRKIDALLNFLKSWDIDAELRTTDKMESSEAVEFSLSRGIWSDYDVNAEELRDKAWKR